jgi:hypothetical protein
MKCAAPTRRARATGRFIARRQAALPARRQVFARCEASTESIEKATDKFPHQVVAVLGTQWGDEGKGKLIDILARQYDIVARAQGGANAGHTIYDDDGNKYKLHLIPSGILNDNALCVIGNGVVVNLPGLLDELENLEKKGIHNVKVRSRAVATPAQQAPCAHLAPAHACLAYDPWRRRQQRGRRMRRACRTALSSPSARTCCWTCT